MTDGIVAICMGVMLVLAAFTITGFARKATPPVSRWSPPTARVRIVLLVLGIVFIWFGITKL